MIGAFTNNQGAFHPRIFQENKSYFIGLKNRTFLRQKVDLIPIINVVLQRNIVCNYHTHLLVPQISLHSVNSLTSLLHTMVFYCPKNTKYFYKYIVLYHSYCLLGLQNYSEDNQQEEQIFVKSFSLNALLFK